MRSLIQDGNSSKSRELRHSKAPGRTPSVARVGSPTARILALQRLVGNQAIVDSLQSQERSSPDMAVNVQRDGDPVTATGTALAAGLVPASFATPAGLPAFRYNLPNIPVAKATAVTPNAVVELELLLRGNVQATPSGSVRGVSVDQTGFRLQADTVVNGLNHGMRINGIGRNEVSIGTTWGTDLESNEVRFTPPNRFAYIGQVALNFNRALPVVGVINFRGQVGFELRATVTPLPFHGPEAMERSWWERNWERVVGTGLIVGAGLLVAGTVVEDVVTGGAGIADDPASLAAAAAMARAGAAAF